MHRSAERLLMLLKELWREGVLSVVLIIVIIITALIYFEYKVTERALTELTLKKPSASVIWYSMFHNVRVEYNKGEVE